MTNYCGVFSGPLSKPVLESDDPVCFTVAGHNKFFWVKFRNNNIFS